MPSISRYVAALALVLLTMASAHAHQLWLEHYAEGARLYFGEFGDNLREVSPGRLDKFVGLTAVHLSTKGERTLVLTKTANAFAVPTRVGTGESLVVHEAHYPLFEKKEGDKPLYTAWTPAARYVADFRAQTPKLTLDIVPTGNVGEFRVIYRDQPLAKVKVSLIASSGWSREKRTDEGGLVRFTLPWKGVYVLEARHTDPTPGQRRVRQGGTTVDEPYDVASYVTTLSFASPRGLASPPAPRPVAPSPS